MRKLDHQANNQLSYVGKMAICRLRECRIDRENLFGDVLWRVKGGETS